MTAQRVLIQDYVKTDLSIASTNSQLNKCHLELKYAGLIAPSQVSHHSESYAFYTQVVFGGWKAVRAFMGIATRCIPEQPHR